MEKINEELLVFEEEKLLVQQNMIKYGGSFVKRLGEALARADSFNTRKIKNAFSEYWEEYKSFGVKK